MTRVAMKGSSKHIAITLISSLLFGAVGFGFGAGFGDVLKDDSAKNKAPVGSSADELAALKSDLNKARKRIALLEDSLNQSAAAKFSNSKDDASLPKPTTQLPKAKAKVSSLQARIAELEAALKKERKGKGPLSDEDMRVKIDDTRAAFADALAAKDGKAAIKLMRELAELDERAYPALVELWQDMEKNKWLGLDWRKRGKWATSEIFHWALTNNDLKLSDPALAKKFQKQAVWMLRWYEDDDEKKAQTYASFLAGMNVPAEMTKEEREANRRNRWGRGPGNDMFRSSLNSLADIRSAEASRVLTDLAANSAAPSDVRLTAVRGLGKQDDASSLLALRAATQDNDPKIRQTATIGLARRDPPVTGWLITSVSSKSQAEGGGIDAGSIITGYNGKPVTNTRELVNAIQAAKGSVTLEVFQNGQRRTVTVNGGQRLGVNGEGVAKK